MQPDDSDSVTPGQFLPLIGFGLALACYLHSAPLGVRVMGILALVCAAYWLRSGRIPFGVRGRAPSGYITGVAVVAVSVVLIAIGLFCLLAPHQVLPLLGSHKFSAPYDPGARSLIASP